MSEQQLIIQIITYVVELNTGRLSEQNKSNSRYQGETIIRIMRYINKGIYTGGN
jgi:hypothetical protein